MQPLQSLLPNPDGTIDAADRFHLLGLYGGLTAVVGRVMSSLAKAGGLVHKGGIAGKGGGLAS